MSISKNQNAVLALRRMKIKETGGLMAAKRLLARKYREKIFTNSELLKSHRDLVKKGKLPSAPAFERILRKRQIRTLSGIAPVAVLTKPFPCPGQCAYCPSEKNVPQSYLSNEPAVMRAIRCGYDPYKQVQLRLRALEANGHRPEKIELIVIGGTWSVLPNSYKYKYLYECFRAANEYSPQFSNKFKIQNSKFNQNLKFKIKNLKQLLKKEQKKNEKAKYRIIGITIETRPDYIDKKELWQLRELGVTRVELGVQAADDKILALNKRGHGVAEIAAATKLLKNFGFKVTYHIMPGLPGATAGQDLKLFKKLFADERFQPDQLKFYPTVVTRGSLLYQWWKTGKYRPYSDRILQNLIVRCKAAVPPYVRIIRLIRDIPGESIVAGNKITNLRQVMQARGIKCACIRCREIKDKEFKILNFKFKIIKYNASGGAEYFLQFTDKTGKYLYGFCRLRLPGVDTECPIGHSVSTPTALIRELHVYGELVPVGTSVSSAQVKKVQHSGLGKKLLAEAERIARDSDYEKIAVIAGVGVREYYRKLGYKLKETYMVKVV